MKRLTTGYLARQINGKLMGNNVPINGIFNILKDSKKGDVVIRHRIDENGVEMASERGVSSIITQNPTEKAVEAAELLGLPLIFCDKIELANAFAIKWAVQKYAEDALCIVVTGTNGKSTTTHLIYNILEEAGYNAYTNTDSLSEFNTLIDPMVAKQIAEFPGKIEAMAIEVSEVQGWMDRIMESHAQIMTTALDPQMVVLTNVALDHIGLVNSLEEAFEEISGSIKGFKGDFVVLNSDDPLIKKMEKFVPSSAKVVFYGSGSDLESRHEGIFHKGLMILEKEELPFKSPHFIQNILAAVAAALTLDIDLDTIKKAVLNYKPLDRRFIELSQNPLIIDDFAHNPDGIKATIKSAAELTRGKLYLVSAIRGSRGEAINQSNAAAVAEGLEGVNYQLIVTSSVEVVDQANLVKSSEKNIFIETLENRGLNCIFHEKLCDALKYTIESSKKTDTILLIGAQGMDPAEGILRRIGALD